ncbi:hypothetical protein PV05_04105 [Exophiala xenobiotica]|uniref:MARVEL domain-containing protein n=1 Tax=Exophiala xenobiotica TaxID=348802 RepID=A0A0D2EY83_9EURO|nr:uncharacterized protein PV05_04105 [Exophiala xenobiotica]KIW59670.1 hypothetical protein PV05_04105 [Exophiala xenobiotica]
MPSTKMRSRPQVYPRLAFHIIRAIAFISAVIVSGILTYFCIQLKHDGFKLPWTFIVILLGTLLSILALLVTQLVYSCAFLNPLVNLFSNVLILLVWTVGLALLTWNMYGALGHSCSRSNWASDDGMMVCRTYKALYSFSVFGWLAQVALIVLDIRSRRRQTALGRYNKMMDSGPGERDVKLDNLDDRNSTTSSLHSHSHSHSQDNVPYGVPDYASTRPTYRPAPTHSASDYSGNATHGQVRMDHFGTNYDRFAPQSYANNGYGYGPQR